jgi:Flp pilus assembly protein TadD
VAARLSGAIGPEWATAIPEKILSRAQKQAASEVDSDFANEWPEYLQLPDIGEIIRYRSNWLDTFQQNMATNLPELELTLRQLKRIRDRVYHAREASEFELDKTYVLSEDIARIIGPEGKSLLDLIGRIRPADPGAYVLDSNLLGTGDIPTDNLPAPEYDEFVGRTSDIREVAQLVRDPRYQVITVTGVGGVGKTGLVRRVLDEVWLSDQTNFEYAIWVSGKDRELTLTGVQQIVPSLKDYEDILDAILVVMDFDPLDYDSVDQKHEAVKDLLSLAPSLIVIDNYESVTDARVERFILDLPYGTKVVITSRRGIGQVERRYPLAPMSPRDVRVFGRVLAREQHLIGLQSLSDDEWNEILSPAEGLPLGVKWIIGQVALGSTLEEVRRNSRSGSSEFIQFSFGNVFKMLSENAQTLMCTLGLLREPPSAARWGHVAGLGIDEFQDAVREITLASLIQAIYQKNVAGDLEERYQAFQPAMELVNEELRARPELRNQALERLRELTHQEADEADGRRSQRSWSVNASQDVSDSDRLARINIHRALSSNRAGDTAKAESFFGEAVRLAPDLPDTYLAWAGFEEEQGNPSRTDELMETATRLRPEDVDLWLRWAEFRRRSGDAGQSREYLRSACDADPSNFQPHELLGLSEMYREAFDEAEQQFVQALDLNDSSQNPSVGIRIRRRLAHLLVRWATQLRLTNELNSANQRLDEAERYSSEVRESGLVDARNLFETYEIALERARIQARQGSHESANNGFINASIPKASSHRDLTHNAWCAMDRARLLVRRTPSIASSVVLDALTWAPDGKIRDRLEQFRDQNYLDG